MEDYKSLSKLILRQSQLLNLASLYLSDHAVLLQNALKKCENCFIEPATVEHRKTKIIFCDHCAASHVVSENKFMNMSNQEHSLSKDQNWIDIDNADKIRRLSDYVKIIKELDVSNNEVQ